MQLRAPGLPQLETLLDEFPSTPGVVLDHMARPAPDDAANLFSLARYSNLFLKFTTHNVRDAAKAQAGPQAFMRRVVEAFGARRIAWGSNYPASEGSLGELARRGAAGGLGLAGRRPGVDLSRTARAAFTRACVAPR